MMMSIDMRNTQHLARLQFLLIHWFDLTGFKISWFWQFP
jgi:hypothetical protein